LPGARTFSSLAQKIAEFEINDRIVLQPHTWYTCPANKKAIVSGRVQCTGRGAAARANFSIAGVIMFEWDTAAQHTFGENYLTAPRGLSTANGGEFALFDGIELSAGDTIVTDQDSGTNAEFNVWAKVQETPA